MYTREVSSCKTETNHFNIKKKIELVLFKQGRLKIQVSARIWKSTLLELNE